MTPLVAAARLAESGCHVLAVKPRGKVPATERGCLDATRDPEQIAAWWTRWPTANIGITTGPSALLVIDLDGPEGLAAWRQLLAEHPQTPRTLTSRTGGSGWHLWFLAPVDRRLGNSASKIASGIDSRGRGGFVVAPPSIHPSGTRYEWSARQPAEMAVLPEWIVDLLDPPPPVRLATRPAPVIGSGYAAAALAREIEELRGAPVGRRNDSLCRASFSLGQLVAAGRLDRRAVLAELLTAAQGIGLGDREAERTVISGMAAGAEHPRAAA